METDFIFFCQRVFVKTMIIYQYQGGEEFHFSDSLGSLCKMRFNPCEMRFDSHEVRLNPHEMRFNPCEIRFDSHEVRLNPHEMRFNPHKVRMNRTSENLENSLKVKILFGKSQNFIFPSYLTQSYITWVKSHFFFIPHGKRNPIFSALNQYSIVALSSH